MTRRHAIALFAAAFAAGALWGFVLWTGADWWEVALVLAIVAGGALGALWIAGWAIAVWWFRRHDAAEAADQADAETSGDWPKVPGPLRGGGVHGLDPAAPRVPGIVRSSRRTGP